MTDSDARETRPNLPTLVRLSGSVQGNDDSSLWCPEDLRPQLAYFNSVLEPLGYRLASVNAQGRTARIEGYSVYVEDVLLMSCSPYLTDGIIDLCPLFSESPLSLSAFKIVLLRLDVTLLADGTIRTPERSDMTWKLEKYPSQYHVLVADGSSGYYLARVTPENCWLELETLVWMHRPSPFDSPSEQ